MTSIYQRALGAEFDRLHPRIQERFSITSAGDVAFIGDGVMDEVWRGSFITVPFLYIGTMRSIMFPETGRDIPFTIENYAFRDGYGRETVSWVRTFRGARQRRFDAYMIYSEQRQRIIDYLGTHEHLAVDIDLSVSDRGGIRLRSGAQRFYAGPVGFPFPMLFSGTADVHEWFDDAVGEYRIEVAVSNRVWGPLFGYRGRFAARRALVERSVPRHILPKREERRD